MTERVLVRSAVLAHHAVADRTTAAWLHGLIRSLPEVITLAADQAPRPGRWTFGDVDLVRRTYCADDVTDVDGIAVTALPTTVLLTADLIRDGSAFADRMLQKKIVTVPQLVAACERHSGRAGAPALRKLLDVVTGDSESIAERLFVELLTDAGIEGWVQQLRFEAWRLDFGWPELKVCVEIQGLAFHRAPGRLANDEAKANALERARWRRLGFTWHQLTDDPIRCIESVIEVLNQQADEVA
ncbi:hypothetical protein [Gordonia sp. MP11Mi]